MTEGLPLAALRGLVQRWGPGDGPECVEADLLACVPATLARCKDRELELRTWLSETGDGSAARADAPAPGKAGRKTTRLGPQSTQGLRR